MNPERMLAYYDQIADAPNAIDRLRRFILDLAVCGKLTSYQLKEAEILSLGELASFIMGQAPPGSTCNKEGRGTTFVKVGEFGERFPVHAAWTTEPLKFAERGDVLICVVGATIGKLNLGIDCAIGRSVAAIRPQPRLSQVFLYYSLMPVTMRLREDSRGTAQGVISRPDLVAIPVWCPPLAEQHRIVAKVDELMALCDQLEAARAEREATRDRLTASSLSRLSSPDPETFQDGARFVLNAIPVLTTRPDQIKQLRQTILNLAVRGKLVPQDPNDEPASELVKRIAKERARTGKREKVEVDIKNEEELSELPPTWFAVPLIALGSWAIGSGFPKNEQGSESGPYFFLKVSDMNLPGNEKYITTSNNFIDDDAGRRMRAKIHPSGTIIFPKIGGAIATNKRRILTRGSAIDNNCLGITFSSTLNIDWAYLLLTTIDFTRYQAGTAVPALQQGVLERIPVGLPPLAEQHRIVAKVDELMGLCDQLEACLTDTAATRSRLLDSLLAETLEPA